MSDDKSGSGESAALGGVVPVLGGGSPTPLPTATTTSSGGGGAGASKSAPGGDNDPEYLRRFEEAALEFGSDAYVFKQIDMLRRNKVPAVLFLGVRTSGKTWLMQRMKKILRDKYDCKPPLAIARDTGMSSEEVMNTDIAATKAQIEKELQKPLNMARLEEQAGNDTDRTSAIIFHRFLHRSGSFALIDVPGELVEQIGKDEFEGNRGVLAALDYASAVIVALPSDVVLLGTELSALSESKDDAALRELQNDADLLEGFINGIGTIASVRSFIKANEIALRWKPDNDPADAFDLQVTGDAVLEHRMHGENCQPIGGPDGQDCPAYFALTKADRFFATLNMLPDRAADGPLWLQRFSKGNQALEATPQVALLKECFKESPINPANKGPGRDLLSRFMHTVFGSGTPTLEVSNPPELVRTLNTPLFNRLTDYMPMSRMDLVSAFYGNTRKTLSAGDFAVNGYVGVDELIEWLGEVRENGITLWHVWARNVFRVLYGSSEDMRGVFSGPGRFEARRRIRWMPRPLLKWLFRKEWHPLQWLPAVLVVLGTLGMSIATFNWTEQTRTIADSRRYSTFEGLLLSANTGTLAPDAKAPIAIASIKPPLSPPLFLDYTKLGRWDPAQQLTGWDGTDKSKEIKVPDSFDPPLGNEADLPTITAEEPLSPINQAKKAYIDRRWQQKEWFDKHVCTLSGWGDYRDIVRKAVISGYGNCDQATILAARSPVVDRLGPAGILVLLAGWVVVLGIAIYTRWLFKTRAAYAWLYHSRAATSRRSEAHGQDNGQAA